MNTQPWGQPTDVEILTAKRLEMSPFAIHVIMEAWEQAYDDLAEWVADGNSSGTFKDGE